MTFTTSIICEVCFDNVSLLCAVMAHAKLLRPLPLQLAGLERLNAASSISPGISHLLTPQKSVLFPMHNAGHVSPA